MSYVSFGFLLFTSVCFGLYYILPQKFRRYVLLAASVCFYVIFSKYLIAASALIALFVYLISNKIGKIDEKFSLKKKELSKEERKEEKKRIKSVKKKLVAAECAAAFLVLAVFKYAGFFTGLVNRGISLFSSFEIPIVTLMMPVGISYYTLSIVSYAVDVYRGTIKPEKNFASLYLFTIYFPHIIEGPIGNYQSFSEQVKNPQPLTYEKFMRAFELILLGLVKKMIIADRAGIICSSYFDNYSDYGTAVTVLNMILYTVNIYFDFSGCMDIVCGVSGLFGIQLPENFRQPFFSKSIQEFWRRWHITLGDWIKKYIFYPVSLSKLNQKIMSVCGEKIKNVYYKTTLPMMFALLFVWLFNGIWHGASGKYILYGIYYYIIISLGLLLEPVFENLCKKLSINRESKPYKAMQIARTCVLVIIGLTLFRADSFTDFIKILGRLFAFGNPVADIIKFYGNISLSLLDFPVIVLFSAAMLYISVKKENGCDLRAGLEKKQKLRWALCTAAVICILLLGVYGTMYTEQPFVYGQF